MLILSDRFRDLKKDLIGARFEQTKHPEGKDKNNTERHRVFDEALSLVMQEGFGRRLQVVSTFKTWDRNASTGLCTPHPVCSFSIIGILC